MHANDAVPARVRRFFVDAADGVVEGLGVGLGGSGDLALTPVPKSRWHGEHRDAADELNLFPPNRVQIQLFVDRKVRRR
jgi:hypothetical protein